MPIKVGFSTSVCPQWDLAQVADRADAMGFYGVELGTVNGAVHLPAAPEFQTAQQVEAVRTLFDKRRLEIVSLATRHAVDARDPQRQAQAVEKVAEVIDLAARLGCAYVRMPLAAAHRGESADSALPRQLPALRMLADRAAQVSITLLVHNTADFPDSRALWTVVDGVAHPRLRCAWKPVLGLGAGERSTTSIPRLGARIRMLQVADAAFDEAGRFLGFRALGDGMVDWERTVDLLKGVVFSGYLMLDWPARALSDWPAAETILPQALACLIERIQHQAPGLTAYQKDKNAPNWSAAGPAFVERGRTEAAENAAAATPAGAS